MVKITVIGAGIMGLTTAVQLQDALPNAEITIIAADWDSETTSAGAGGIFRFNCDAFAPSTSKYRQYGGDSAKHWKKCAMSTEASKMGVMSIIVHEVLTYVPTKPLLYTEFVFGFQEKTPSELSYYGSSYVYGFTVGSWIINGPIYLRYLKARFTERGGRCVRRKLTDLSELSDLDCGIIVNCSGLGSRWLFKDEKVHAVRGDVLQVHAPWIKNAVVADASKDTYIIPQPDYVVVGGSRVEDVYDTRPDVEAGDRALERAIKLYPPLKGAKIIKRWAGLRPARDEFRVETERMVINGKTVTVVHNYGHGAMGICLSWGSSLHATTLVLQQLANSISSKL